MAMDRKMKILELAKQRGIIRPRSVEGGGISREYLLRLYRKGDLTRVDRGLYALSDSLTSESVTLAEVAKRVPNAVVCLLSALQFHNLTTQLSPRAWIAIESRKWKPELDYPPIEVVHFSGRAFNFGVEVHEVDR